MKHILNALLLAVFAVAGGCKPELEEIGPAYPAGEGIYGTWEVAMVKQVDLTQPIPETRDISSYFTSDASRKTRISFSKDNNQYTVPQIGALPRMLKTNGTWAYDTLPFPSQITFISESNDTFVAPLHNMPREIDQNFGFDLTRKDSCGTSYLRYELDFKRVN
jgi:hypothetical protein